MKISINEASRPSVVVFFVLIATGIFLSSCVDENKHSNVKDLNSSNNPVAPNNLRKTLVLNPVTNSDTAGNVVLTVVRRLKPFPYATDYMLSSGYTENPPEAQDFGQLAYITGDTVHPSGSYNLKILYRAWNDSLFDHMSTWNPNEVANLPHWMIEPYTTGKVWDGSVQYSPFFGLLGYGAKLLYRYEKETGNFDHDAGFSIYPPSGYLKEPYPLGWAFQRYGTASTTGDSIAKGTISMVTNKVAGGIIWSLYSGSTQLINHWTWSKGGVGRELQICLVRYNQSWNSPNEGGDNIGYPYEGTSTDWLHGSPLTNYSITTGSVTTLNTEVYPLLYEPQLHYVTAGLDRHEHPVMWRGKIGKSVVLGAFPGYPEIITWTTKLTFASADEWINSIETISCHLVNDFKTIYLYYPQTRSLILENVPYGQVWDPTTNSELDFHHDSTNRGVIIKSVTRDLAVGCYGHGPLPPYQCGFVLVNLNVGSYAGADDYACSKFGWGEYPGNSASTITNYPETLYLIVGTLGRVEACMNFLAGVP